MKKRCLPIAKHLHVTKDGAQLIDYQKLFKKKLNLDPVDVHADINCKLNGNQKERIVMQSSLITVFGGFENSNILHSTVQNNEVSITIQTLQLNILLNADTNTNGCTHWFYFAITAAEPGIFKVKILNNRRKASLYQRGSHIMTQTDGSAWTHSTISKVFYYRTNINHPYYFSEITELAILQEKIDFYTLEFSIELKKNSYTRVAMNLPYTYKDLLTLQNDLALSSTNFKTIGTSPLGNAIFKIKFTKHTYYLLTQQNKNRSNRQSVVILARQHPSETAGSHICDAILRALAKQCRIPYRVVVFPMANPDGVVLGNSRCNFNGVDLNRKWDLPDDSATEIVMIKREIEKLNGKYPVQFVIDLHGHSSQMNQFIYGCSPEKITTFMEYINAKMFARLMSTTSRYFDYQNSCFRVTSSKQSTARVTFFQQFGILNSITIETSFLGSLENDSIIVYCPEHYIEMGNSVIKCLERFNDSLKEYTSRIDHLVLPRQFSKKVNFINNVNSIFPNEELQTVQILFAKGINPLEKEPLPDSDTEAEQDLKLKRRFRKSQYQFKNTKQQEEEIQITVPKQFFSKIRTLESDDRPIKRMRRQHRIKEPAHVHFIDFNNSVKHSEIPRLVSSHYEEDFSTTQQQKMTTLHNTFLRRSIHPNTRRQNHSFDLRISQMNTYQRQESPQVLFERLTPVETTLYGISYTSCSNGQQSKLLQAKKLEPTAIIKAFRNMKRMDP